MFKKDKLPDEQIQQEEQASEILEDAIAKEESGGLLRDIVEHYTVVDKRSLQLVKRGFMSKEDFLVQVEDFLKGRKLSEKEIKDTISAFKKYVWGYHVIDDLIHDKDISDIKIMSDKNVRIKRLGKRESTNVKFNSVDDYVSFVNYIATKNQTNISDINAIQTFTDKETNPDFILRFDIMTQFVTSSGMPYVHIRKIPKKKLTLEDLRDLGMLDQKTVDLLKKIIVDATGIYFTGKGASGKTTLMNACLEEIPHNFAGLVVQENEELFSDTHPELMFEHVVTSRGEAKIQYDLSELSINGLLTDLDYFIIGEIKGKEAVYFANASYTGHKCWASGHGASSTEAFGKLVDYIKYASNYSKIEAMQTLKFMEYIIFMKDFKVAEISKVVGWNEEKQDFDYERIL